MINFPKWLPLNEIKYIAKILQQYGDTRLVGGCVREILAGHGSKDIDLATQVVPEKALELFEGRGIKCIPIGLKHGTIAVIYQGHTFEITTLRRDIETYGRHAKVEFTDDWPEDAQRRDFTFNAMYLDLEGNLYDYFDGAKDLKNKIIRFVGEPHSRIREDYLRIIRYFRFYSYFGGNNIDTVALDACKDSLKGLDMLSGERIAKEMMRILSSEYARESLLLMNEINLLPHIALKKLSSGFVNFRLSDISLVNLAALIYSTSFTGEEFLQLVNRWKLSKKQINILNNLCFKNLLALPLQNRIIHKTFIYRYGYELYNLNLMLYGVMNPEKRIIAVKNWQPPKFPISGHDLKKLSIEGKNLGVMLRELEESWIKSDFKLTMQELLSNVPDSGYFN